MFSDQPSLILIGPNVVNDMYGLGRKKLNIPCLTWRLSKLSSLLKLNA